MSTDTYIIGVYVHRAYQSLDHKCVNEAFNAAIKILNVFVEGKHYVIPSIAVHCGQ